MDIRLNVDNNEYADCRHLPDILASWGSAGPGSIKGETTPVDALSTNRNRVISYTVGPILMSIARIHLYVIK